MKKIITGLAILLITTNIQAQLSPVTWSFTANKKSDKSYEIHMKANIQDGWHLYSQSQPADAIAIPTGFSFNKNPLLSLDGKIKEVGTMEKFHDVKLDLSAYQYSGSVDFVQDIKLKVKSKTSITGNLEYQTCNNQKCLPPKKVNFNIPIQ